MDALPVRYTARLAQRPAVALRPRPALPPAPSGVAGTRSRRASGARARPPADDVRFGNHGKMGENGDGTNKHRDFLHKTGVTGSWSYPSGPSCAG